MRHTEELMIAHLSSGGHWVYLVYLDFAEGAVYAHNGLGPIEWQGHSYVGTGALGRISQVKEGIELRPYTCNVSLSGIDPALLSIALSQRYLNRRANVWLAAINEDNSLVSDPVMLFSGTMDAMKISLGETATITVPIQSALADWDRPRQRRYNHADQTQRYPEDRGFEYIEDIVNRPIF